MSGREKSGGRKCKVQICLFLVLVTVSLWGLGVETSFAQLSGNEVSYAFTGGAIPRNGFLPLMSTNGIKAGSFRIHPFFGAGEIFTDNAFRTSSNRQSDFVHTVSPGIQIQLPFAGLHRAAIDYRATKSFSQRFPSNNVLNQDLRGQVLLNFPGGLEMKLQGGYAQGFDLRGSELDLQFLEPTKWAQKTFIGEAETIGSQFGVRLRVRAVDREFKNNNQAVTRDRLSSQGNITVFGLIAPKTYALLNFGVTRQVYDQNTQLDSMNYQMNTGLRWRATGKTTGEIQVGYTFLIPDRAPRSQPSGSPLSSGGSRSDAIQVSGSLNWQPASRLNMSLRPSRSIQQSGILGTSTFTQTAIDFTANYTFGALTSINANFNYADSVFENDQGNLGATTRKDNNFGGGFGVTYQAVRWLGVTAQYRYDQRSSTIAAFESYANTLMVSIQGIF
ncbi:outer membrane beta-barrel protein [Candidatus Nitronereus thalassa]|uniref:Outer membrane beta-barrel protein n=1 Tax=Candidatus Nitronereus thalassa TaxID=3020898 RepID=A0ABU3K595_9BACT|nr:outer membrane beta-barrel protein [Candidatus Nitronereus thalassa]MDT7041584.1 outer membrane beta-barrel protein [Candidatus Nitronereus thalassa]